MTKNDTITKNAADDAQNTVQLVPAEIVDNSEAGANEADADAATAERRLTPAIRHVLERQLIAGQALSGELVIAATDVTAAVVEAPAKVVAAVRDGATLPTAFGQTGDALQDAVADAGSRVRSAVGHYVGGQATLPNAVLTGVAEVAGSLVRAQGAVAGTAVGSALAVAAVATRAGDVRDALDQEWRELAAAGRSAREDVSDTLADARQGLRLAVAEPAFAT